MNGKASVIWRPRPSRSFGQAEGVIVSHRTRRSCRPERVLTVREQVDPRAVRGNELMEMSPVKLASLNRLPARSKSSQLVVLTATSMSRPPEPRRPRGQDPRDRRADHDNVQPSPREALPELDVLTSSGLRAIREVRQILLGTIAPVASRSASNRSSA
jgi:hypothetical protein